METLRWLKQYILHVCIGLIQWLHWSLFWFDLGAKVNIGEAERDANLLLYLPFGVNSLEFRL